MVDLKIENIIAAVEFKTNLDLKKIADSIDSAEYDPDQFPGLIYKLRRPKTITLIFSRGYSVCSGATSIPNAKAALIIIYKKLKDLNVINLEKPPKIIIRDIVTSYKFEKPLTLDKISKKLPASNIEYNPREFPGLVYHDKATNINVLIFDSGKIVGYGNPYLFELEQLMAELEQFYT
jgi:transcription initiation factor TFIID TATA-box-binding protein